MLNAILGIWITFGLVLGFAVPKIHDASSGLVLATPQIAFFHVPMAVAMEVAFLLAAWNGAMWLKKRDAKYDALSISYAEIGAIFGAIATVTGAIFAKANWGAYWSWDPQESGIVTTLLTYAALFALRGAVDDDIKKRDLWAAYAIFGFVIAMFSTMVYRRLLPAGQTLHPPNTLLTSDPLNKFALWFNVAGYVFLMVRLAGLRARLESASVRLRELRWA